MEKITRKWIEDLNVGDLVPDCFGDIKKVTKIVTKGEDMFGRLFVVVYTDSKISRSFKEGELRRD